ncbi:MAG: AsmA family protein [Endomicrobium sp.]|jgi:AsmA protein|nr:AsmA family protein [Endomicrobium sp.]
MKKFFKWMFILFVIIALLIAGLLTALYIMYPPSKLKAAAQDYVKNNFNREISFDSLSLNIVGVNLNGFAFSERGGFSKGTFVSARKAVVKLELKPLFSKKIEIKTIGLEDIVLNITKEKDGKFNFDDIIENAAKLGGGDSAQKTPSSPSNAANAAAPLAGLALVADNVYIKNSTINYTDKADAMAFSVRKFNFNIKDFELTHPFTVEGSFLTDVKLQDINLSSVSFSFKGILDLAEMSLKDASFNLLSFETAYKSLKILLGGKIYNFETPSADLKGTIAGVDNKLAQEFISEQLPAFALPQINVALNTISNIENGSTKINEAKISIGNSYVRTTADINYSKDLNYKSDTKISLSLKEIGDIAKEDLSAFKLDGTLSGNIAASDGAPMPHIKGSVDLKNIGAAVMNKELKNLNGTITINSLDDIKTNLIKGIFDGSNFSTSLAYAKPAKTMNIDFFFDMDKFTLDDVNFDTLFAAAPPSKPDAAAQQPAAQAAAKQPQPQQQSFACTDCQRSSPVNFKAALSVHEIANNIFNTKELKLNADIKNLDNKLDAAAGTITFSTKNGEIRDIDKLMNSSVILKIALTSVRVVQKAFGFLKLESSSFRANKITYSLIEGAYTLNNGIITINKTDIDADLTTVKSSGSVNLLNEKLDMKIESHLGKMGSSGFKPVVIKVGGTINEPSYKLDVASTLASVLNVPGSTVKGGADVSATAVKGVVDGATSAVKGVANLFKKKK